MKSKFKTVVMVAAWLALSHMPTYGEIADPVYRDGVFGTYINHAALLYRYDNAAIRWDVIQSKGGGDYAANSVVIGTWSDFLAGNNFTGQKCPANISKGVRDSVLNDALDQLNAHYFSINLFTACYKRPNSSPGSGDGCFRCDFLVEWCYEQNGYNICNDALLYAATPSYQRDSMPDAIQTPPYNVSMSYPSSTDPNNPTVSSSSSITLRASASDTHSGLSYNKPFNYYYAKYENGSWGSWIFLASDSETRNQTILTANTPYSWYVEAFDNSGNAAVSSVYYFKWVPVVNYTITVVANPSNGGTVSGGGTYTVGSSQQISATANSGWTFTGWSDGGAQTHNVTVPAGGATYTANFQQQTATITVVASPSNGGAVSGGGTYTVGSSQQISANANSGWTFIGWSDGGAQTHNVTVQAGGARLTANFVDVTKPTLTITAPIAGQHMTNALATVVGTASDNWKVAGVWYQLNSNAWNLVTTTNSFTNWTKTVTLLVGTNTLKTYALDLGGNFSVTNTLSVVSSNTFKLQLAFTNALPMKTNGLVFSLQLSKGLNGHIQVSSNLTSWATLTNFIGTNTTLNFRDPAATNASRRFYRAVIP